MKIMEISALIIVLLSTILFGLNGAEKPGYCWKEVKRPKEMIDGSVTVEEYIPVMKEICCQGYTLLRQNCEPLCEQPCINSKCTAPNMCSCEDGYKKLNASTCEPACENCEKGFCLAPGECECSLGYEKDLTTGKCVPLCNLPCINGYCTDPKVCTCHIGYHKSEKNTHTCIRNANQETTDTVDETIKGWEEISWTTKSVFSSSSWREEMMVSSESSTVETSTETERNDFTAVYTEDEEHSGYFDKGLSQVIDSSTEIFESTTENPSDQTTATDELTGLISLSPLQSTEFTIDSTVWDEIEFITKQGFTDNTVKSSVMIAGETSSTEKPKDSLRVSNLTYVSVGAVLIILIICLMVLNLIKHSKKTTYNIAEIEQTNGVAKYSSEKDTVMASWEMV